MLGIHVDLNCRLQAAVTVVAARPRACQSLIITKKKLKIALKKLKKAATLPTEK